MNFSQHNNPYLMLLTHCALDCPSFWVQNVKKCAKHPYKWQPDTNNHEPEVDYRLQVGDQVKFCLDFFIKLWIEVQRKPQTKRITKPSTLRQQVWGGGPYCLLPWSSLPIVFLTSFVLLWKQLSPQHHLLLGMDSQQGRWRSFWDFLVKSKNAEVNYTPRTTTPYFCSDVRDHSKFSCLVKEEKKNVVAHVFLVMCDSY